MPPFSGGAESAGKPLNWYEAGDSFPDDDGCNTCTCLRGGLVACTRMSCSGTPTPDYVK
ncbi:hypothetical protein DPMN_049056 [Dreissena polymorpha]|uniref:Pacifastin domain-containing protein n=1 Tax=Dreissena polymorpha TaxID=45954 RepID=A0A9D4I4H6_DREPO|nr:hypothetical protein DPMN_049056 [Dreissena polymorpha]